MLVLFSLRSSQAEGAGAPRTTPGHRLADAIATRCCIRLRRCSPAPSRTRCAACSEPSAENCVSRCMRLPGVAVVVVIASQLIFAAGATAAIVQPSAGAGCAEMRAEQRCARGNGTQSSVDVAFSPDSRYLY